MVVRVCRVISILLLMAFGASASETPPPVHMVNGHWTAWNPPDPSVYPAGSEVHIINQGETLWGLAQTMYGNGELWPQLWEQNSYILDAHWIYPGDPLLVVREGVTGTAGDTTSGVSSEEGSIAWSDDNGEIDFGSDANQPKPFALASVSDVYCYGYLGHENENWPNSVVAFEDSEVKYVKGALDQDIGATVEEIVYIGGDMSLVAGDQYMLIRPGEIITHPVTGESLGREYEYVGQIRILCPNSEGMTAVIVQACDSVHLGDQVRPMPQVPIPLAVMAEWERHCNLPSGKSSGYIVNAKDHVFALGEGMMVQVNLGSEDAITPGDFLTVYRPNMDPHAPRLILGEVGIVTTDLHSAIGKIVRMRYSMEVGDEVEIK